MTSLRLSLRSSRTLVVLLSLLHLAAVVSAGLSLAGWPLALVEAGVCLSALGTLGEALQRWPDSALELELRDDGSAAWRDRRGLWHEGRLTHSSCVSTWLAVIGLALPEARARLLVLLADAATPEDLRHLRQWLRWRPQHTRDLQ